MSSITHSEHRTSKAIDHISPQYSDTLDRSNTTRNRHSDEAKDEETKNMFKEKPWIVYLRTLRIPIVCQIHRKLFVMISEETKNQEAQDSKNKLNNASMSSIKKINRNPNWNHNSSSHYNSCAVNIKLDRDVLEDPNQNADLLWKNCDDCLESEEIRALGTVLFKLFLFPRLGECVKDKNKKKMKTIAGTYSQFNI